MTAPWPCNARSRTLSPTWGKRVGGVSERAGAKAGGSNPFANDSFACRDGERHPGLPEGGVLRGASSERGPGSVRRRAAVFLRCKPARRRQRMSRGTPRRGTPSAYAKTRMHPSHVREIVMRSGTRPSLGPLTRARRSSLCTCRAIRTVARRSRRYHGWANLREQEEPTLGPKRTDVARLAACPRSSRGACGRVRKGRRSRPPSLRGHESSGLVARTSIVRCRSQ